MVKVKLRDDVREFESGTTAMDIAKARDFIRRSAYAG